MNSPEWVKRIALRLRQDGWSYTAIGRLFGFNKSSVRLWCCPCAEEKHRAYNREYGSENKARFAAHRRKYYRAKSVSFRLGRLAVLARDRGYTAPDITAEAMKRRIGFHDGHCDLCRRATGDTLHMDHDHETGRVRGFLCNPCNLLVGGFERAERAGVLKYLGRVEDTSFLFGENVA